MRQGMFSWVVLSQNQEVGWGCSHMKPSWGWIVQDGSLTWLLARGPTSSVTLWLRPNLVPYSVDFSIGLLEWSYSKHDRWRFSLGEWSKREGWKPQYILWPTLGCHTPSFPPYFIRSKSLSIAQTEGEIN